MSVTRDTLARSSADVDPTRTKTLRRKYAQKLRGGFQAINTEIRAGVRGRDVFGINNDRRTRSQDTLATPLPSQFPERQDRQIETFEAWLQRQLENDVLSTIDSDRNEFATAAYERGLVNAQQKARQLGIDVPDGVDVQTLANRPLHRDELQLIYTRDFSELEGITQAVSQQANRTLAEGLAAGEGPDAIADRLTDRIDKIGQTRASTLARTSVIDTFNSAALNRYEELGVEGVTAEVEFLTAGDDRVCPECADLEGQLFDIDDAKGVIPVHPRCRCTWLPVQPDT